MIFKDIIPNNVLPFISTAISQPFYFEYIKFKVSYEFTLKTYVKYVTCYIQLYYFTLR